MAEEEETSDGDASEEDATQPGEWERKPSDEEERRHDDPTEPPAEPSEDADEDRAEQEAGDVSSGGDEGFDRPDPPDQEEVGDTARKLEEQAEPLLQGSEVKTPIGGLPTRTLLGFAAFIVVFLAAFFISWGLLGSIGILIGIIVGTVLGFGAMKLLADRAE